ncbi:MAG: hypothetical protein AB2747_05395 [Candidatus Thiodiazotropha taylori]
MATLRDIDQAVAELEAAGPRSTTKEMVANLLFSLARVGGVMFKRNGTDPMTIAAGWNRIDTWDNMRDTRGVQDGLQDTTDPGGWMKVRNAGSGMWIGSASIRFNTDTAGRYEIRIGHLDDTGAVIVEPYQDEAEFPAGNDNLMVVSQFLIKNLLAQHKLQLEIRGPNGAVITITHGQFGAFR